MEGWRVQGSVQEEEEEDDDDEVTCGGSGRERECVAEAHESGVG
jgi:hypothetical protein